MLFHASDKDCTNLNVWASIFDSRRSLLAFIGYYNRMASWAAVFSMLVIAVNFTIRVVTLPYWM